MRQAVLVIIMYGVPELCPRNSELVVGTVEDEDTGVVFDRGEIARGVREAY